MAGILWNYRCSSKRISGGNLKALPEELRRKSMWNPEEILGGNSWGNSEKFAEGTAEQFFFINSGEIPEVTMEDISEELCRNF